MVAKPDFLTVLPTVVSLVSLASAVSFTSDEASAAENPFTSAASSAASVSFTSFVSLTSIEVFSVMFDLSVCIELTVFLTVFSLVDIVNSYKYVILKICHPVVNASAGTHPGVTKGPSPRNRPRVTLQQEPIPVSQKDRPHDTPKRTVPV